MPTLADAPLRPPLGAAPRPAPAGLFLPGWSATPDAYRRGLPDGWRSPPQPTFAQTDGRFAAYVAWARELVASTTGPLRLGGHSLGGAVAIAVAALEPGRVEEVVAVAPAGLPLPGAIRRSARDLIGNGLRGRLVGAGFGRAAARVVAAPWQALALGRELAALDLAHELRRLAEHGTRLVVVSGAGDRVVPPEACARMARLGAGVHLRDPGADDHLWVVTRPQRLQLLLAAGPAQKVPGTS